MHMLCVPCMQTSPGGGDYLSKAGYKWTMRGWDCTEGIITACHLTLAWPKGQTSDQNLVWSDILVNEIIRIGLNIWQFLDWFDILSDRFRKVIIPSAT